MLACGLGWYVLGDYTVPYTTQDRGNQRMIQNAHHVFDSNIQMCIYTSVCVTNWTIWNISFSIAKQLKHYGLKKMH